MDTSSWPTDDWKAFFVRWEKEQYHQGNLDLIDEYNSPDLVDHHLPPGYDDGNEGKRRLVRELLDDFPDFRLRMDDLVVERIGDGDVHFKVVEQFTISGTHHGTYRGIQPTGEAFETSGIAMMRLIDGIEFEHWAVVDDLDMPTQRGVFESPLPKGSS